MIRIISNGLSVVNGKIILEIKDKDVVYDARGRQLNNPALKYRGYRCDWKSLVSAKADLSVQTKVWERRGPEGR